ncbi:unnamed protein product [Trichobilharzia regenti]|nr:unnamed protein product [Trichobilharzia regenti]
MLFPFHAFLSVSLMKLLNSVERDNAGLLLSLGFLISTSLNSLHLSNQPTTTIITTTTTTTTTTIITTTTTTTTTTTSTITTTFNTTSTTTITTISTTTLSSSSGFLRLSALLIFCGIFHMLTIIQ